MKIKKPTLERFKHKLNSIRKKAKVQLSKFRKIKRRYLTAISLFFVILIILILLFIFKPTIEINTVNALQNQELPEMINAEFEYPTYNFTSTHRIKFSNGTTINAAKEYTLRSSDFNEGKNIVEIRPQKDYIFFRTISKSEFQEIHVEVDTRRPIMEILNTTESDQLLLEPFLISIKSEVGAKLMNAEVELGQFEKADQKDEDEITEVVDQNGHIVKHFEIIPANGENKLSLYVMDEHGNKTDTVNYEFLAFYQDNFTKVECGDISFAMSIDLRFGLSGIKDYNQTVKDYQGIDYLLNDLKSANSTIQNYKPTCSDKAVDMDIYLKSDSLQVCVNCGGPGVIPDHLDIEKVNDDLDSFIQKIKFEKSNHYKRKILDEKDLTNFYGTKLTYIKYVDTSTGDVPYSGSHYTRHYLFEHENNLYSITLYSFNSSIVKISPYMNDIAEYIRIEESRK